MQANSPPHSNFSTNTSQRATLSPKTINSIEFLSIHSHNRLAEAKEEINVILKGGCWFSPVPKQAGEPDNLRLSLIFITLSFHLKSNLECDAAQ